jgi:hypothetical protein
MKRHSGESQRRKGGHFHAKQTLPARSRVFFNGVKAVVRVVVDEVELLIAESRVSTFLVLGIQLY